MASSHAEVVVQPPKPGPKLEPVSARIKAELIHPNKTSYVHFVRYSPDGGRIIAADAAGLITVSDSATREQLLRVDTGCEFRESDPQISRDGRILMLSYSPEERIKAEQVEKDGKRMVHYEFAGEVRSWSLVTGKRTGSYKQDPPCHVHSVQLSANGTTFVTTERPPGLFERSPPIRVTLWDATTGKSRPFTDGPGVLSPDGRRFACKLEASDRYRCTRELKMLDVSGGDQKWALPVNQKHARAYISFSPDGKILATNYVLHAFEDDKLLPDKTHTMLKLVDTETGRELHDFGIRKSTFIENDTLGKAYFAPDGQAVVTIQSDSDAVKLNFFRLKDKSPSPLALMLGQQSQAERLLVHKPAFSPDGRLLAIVTRRWPADTKHVLDAPQPHIQLIDAATGAIRETLIAPPGHLGTGCFSPDGKTLATGGLGRILLWDLSHLNSKAP